MKAYQVLTMLTCLSACSLFSAPDAKPAITVITEMDQLFQKQTNAFQATIQKATMDESVRKIYLDNLDKDRTDWEKLRTSLTEFIAEIGDVNWQDLYNQLKAILEKVKK